MSNVCDNKMKIEFDSNPINEKFARISISGFITYLDPNIEELNDIKTAVSEAVTNSIIHGYQENNGKIIMECTIKQNLIEIVVEDFGKGIDNIKKAREPLYTTKAEEERSGMGFTIMETFMDEVIVESALNKGTKVTMKKILESEKRSNL